MQLRIENGHLQICNGSHTPVGFGDVSHGLAAGEHWIASAHIGEIVKILRFGHISDCLQRSLRGWILNQGDRVLLTVV